jgi:hypothetical protein
MRFIKKLKFKHKYLVHHGLFFNSRITLMYRYFKTIITNEKINVHTGDVNT